MRTTITFILLLLILLGVDAMAMHFVGGGDLNFELSALLAFIITYCVNEDNKGEEK